LEVSPSIFLDETRPPRKSFFDSAVFRDEDEVTAPIKDRIKKYLPVISKAYTVKRSLGEIPANIEHIKPGFRVTTEATAKELARQLRVKLEIGK